MSIQAAKGRIMVCPQCFALDYWHGWEFNHGDVFVHIHGIQMHMDHWDFKEILSCMALLFADGTRWDLLQFYSGFGVLAPGSFGLGLCWCRCSSWLVWTGWRVRIDRDGLHQG